MAAFHDVLRVGAISALSVVQLNLAVILVTGAMGRFGAAALAGYGMGSRLDYLLIPILFGLGSAVLTMVGACIGAKDIRRAKRLVLAGTMIGAGVSEAGWLWASFRRSGSASSAGRYPSWRPRAPTFTP